MKRYLITLTVLCLLLGCATYPPPKIEGNKYQNYRHGFVLELPGEPWKPTDKPPDWFKSWLISADYPTSNIQLILFNNQTNAFIMVSCSKSWFDIITLDHDALRKHFQKELERRKKESLKLDQVTHYDYEVYSGNYPLYSIEMDIETEVQKIRITSKVNMYPIGDDTHFLAIGLWSDQLTFNENREVFDKLYKSFEWDPLLTIPTAK
jgi:hypothetical protein